MPPLVTVLMPVYNGQPYLREAIQSILEQTYRNFEFLIMDDGSTDNTAGIVKSFGDPRIRFHHSDINRGIEQTLNDGILQAKGEYVARMDADDISLPERIAIQVAFLEKNPDTGVLGSAVRQIGKNWPSRKVQSPLTDDEIRAHFLFHNPMLHPTVMFRKNLGGRIAYPLGFKYAEDYKLWVDIADRTRFANLQETLLLYRIHEGQITKSRQEESRKSTNHIRTDYLKQNFPGLSDQDINIHVSILNNCHGISLIIVSSWLEKLTEINRQTHAFDQEILLKLLGGKWLDCCRKSRKRGSEIHRIFKSSPLSSHNMGNMKNKLKYYLKVLTS